MGLKEKSIHASKWSIGASVLAQVIQLFFSAVMARLLMPQDFGVFGMAFVFIAFLQLFSQLGMGAALIQRKDLDEESISSVFWLNLATGTALCVIFTLSSNAIAVFFHQPVLKKIMLLLSVNFIITSFSIVQSVLLTREMRFKKIAVVSLVSLIFSGFLQICMATRGFGVWSLVWGPISSNIVTAILMWYKSEWKPKFIFCWDKVRGMLNFGFNALGFTLINYFARNIQDILIGRFMNPAALGYYSVANRVMLLPLQHITWRVSGVTFPALSKIQHDKEAVRDAYLQMSLLISMATFPIMIWLAVVAPELITVVLGDKWRPAIIVVQILCGAGLLQSVGASTGSIFLSQGRADLQFKLGLVFSAIVCLAIAGGVAWGINGVAISYTLANVFLFPISMYFTLRLISLKMQCFFRALLPATISAVAMLICLLAFRHISESILRLPKIIFLLSSVFLGAGTYLALLKIAFPEEFKEMRSVIKIATSA